MRTVSGFRRGHLASLSCLALAVLAPPWELTAQVREAAGPAARTVQVPDTVQVDSTRLRIQQRLQGLARPPGIDSTYFLPDSLLPDSLRELREAARARQPGARRTPTPAPRPEPAGVDSVLAALRAMEGYTLTEYQSREADFDAKDRRLVLLGTPTDHARLIFDGQEVTNDSALVYDEASGRIFTLGRDAVFRPREGDPVNSRVLVFDVDGRRGTALDARTKFHAGADWIVHGDLTSVSETASHGSDLSFTSCELEEPHYHFASSNVKIVRDNVMVARPVVLYFADVPVFWLPFMAQSMDRDRASGLLTPTFSVNDIVRTSRGYRRRVSNIGFYWAMSDYYDSTVFLDWWSGEHVSLTGSVRYNWARQFLDGGLNFRQFWREGGGSEMAFDANNNWQMDERTNLRFRARYASSSSFIRRTSFDPIEVVQSIDSEGGLSRRFDFGNLTLSANRRQFLTDDRVEMTLPNVSLSLSPQTFFRASPTQARFYNNMTWSGSGSFRRSISDRPQRPDTVAFSPSLADQVRTNASFNTGLNLGNLSLSSGFSMSENVVKGVPLKGEPVGEDPPPVLGFQDQADAEVSWNASLGYQQRLVGSTSLTPSLSISSRLVRSDADTLASSFVGAPSRVSLSLALRTDLYGFFPGVGPFEAIRHKLSPGFDYSYAPKVSPTAVQEAVFGSREVGAQRVLRISLNQTFEAKRREDPSAAAAQPAAPGAAAPPAPSPGMPEDTLGVGLESTATEARAEDEVGGEGESGAPRSRQEGQKVTLLALRTTAMTYDFERAAELGNWLWGIETTQLTNTISSDYLRGLNLTMTHLLFDDPAQGGGAGGQPGDGQDPRRKFSPHLTQMNFGFSLDSRSLPFRLLSSLLGGEPEASSTVRAAPATTQDEQESPFAPTLTDESSIIPVGDGPARRARVGEPGGAGGWRANLSYSLQRPRSETQSSNQMLQGTLSFNPTENWEVSWRTSFDVANQSFNDHYLRLTRDLHRWEAYFDFRQTATGNWSFRFEVSLTDNRDLHFDYQQRSIQDATGARRF
jgi:hypothetical protein